ncbi:NAD-dependent epimerase/dehydratase family protein [Micromonospora sp. D75]|uniref:NAD-dependent epimerase/dehydratase family protein n=1 Tax=Micromonospora sp. D75 TaxID=2824885 RepID=UPI0028A0B669|nr:NAD-dependent epimerase/dehydratase family protein [Micromonospora sp. D75]
MTGDRPRVVVLGGTGFVGAHVADAFADAGHDVLTVARRAPAGDRHRFTALDLGGTGPGTLARLLDAEDPVAVVDSTGSSWGLDPGRMAERCTRLSALLLDALRRAACRPRLVHLGSVLEYGQPVAPADPRRTPAPDTAYGRAKLTATCAGRSPTSGTTSCAATPATGSRRRRGRRVSGRRSAGGESTGGATGVTGSAVRRRPCRRDDREGRSHARTVHAGSGHRPRVPAGTARVGVPRRRARGRLRHRR